MQILARHILSILCCILTANMDAQPREHDFEGEITFIKETLKDTTYLSYKIKGEKVRYEELNKNLQIDNYMIVDLLKKTIYAVNTKKKLYADMPIYAWNGRPDTINFSAEKTGNYKSINGIKCYQWRIINRKENTEIQYWTPTDRYEFYSEFIKLLNHSDKIFQYYLNSPGIYGLLPLESVERSLVREMRMRLEVVNMESKKLPASVFEIPTEYKLFEKK